MRIVPRASVKVSLTFAILITAVLSWVIGTGTSSYLNYLSFRSLRQEMVKHPDLYPRPFPEPRFGVVEFLTGRPPMHRGPAPESASKTASKSEKPPTFRPEDRHGPSPMWFELRGLILRLVVALGIAVLAGALLGRRFTRPLGQLARGADAFQSGDFAYRIPERGKSEFTAVASAMNEMARRVSDQIGRLEEDSERRRQLLADIAHELRSPVSTMGTMVTAIRDGLADEPQRREIALSALVSTSQRLKRLVQDLMELAKLDLTELPLNLADVDVRELAYHCIRSHEADAAAAGITLNPVQPDEPVRAFVDPDRISQVIDNIIENSITYAGSGAQVSVSIDRGDGITITISDTGKGIRAEDLPHVLDPFYKADPARTPEDGHSGLGLSIAYRLAEAHGGNLTISSEEGKGTTVTVTLPGNRAASPS